MGARFQAGTDDIPAGLYIVSCSYRSPHRLSIDSSFLASIPRLYPEDGNSRTGIYLPNYKVLHPKKKKTTAMSIVTSVATSNLTKHE
jgi:hypothetical protein